LPIDFEEATSSTKKATPVKLYCMIMLNESNKENELEVVE